MENENPTTDDDNICEISAREIVVWVPAREPCPSREDRDAGMLRTAF
jgi:hypothetical protein